MFSFVDIVLSLEGMGLSDVLIPFLLIFAIMFAVLANINIFGKKRKNINLIVAMAIALLVVVPHITGSYPPGYDAVVILKSAIPNVTIVVLAIIMMLILIGIFGVRVAPAGKQLGAVVALISFGLIFFIFGNSAGWFTYNLPPALQFLNDPNTIAVIVVLLVFGLIVMFITSEEPALGTGSWFTGLLKGIGEGLESINDETKQA